MKLRPSALVLVEFKGGYVHRIWEFLVMFSSQIPFQTFQVTIELLFTLDVIDLVTLRVKAKLSTE
jgi:hypothetical protein